MNPGRQALMGVFMTAVSGVLLMGSFLLSITEKGFPIAYEMMGEPTNTWTSAPITYAPGQPTFTETPLPPPTDTSTPLPTPANCPPPSGWTRYKISAWHTLNGIAREFGISPEELAEANCLIGTTLPVGSDIFVPDRSKTTTLPIVGDCKPSPYPGWVRYRVRPGDTLFSIASRFGTTVPTLQRVNCISDPSKITAWEDIWVPNLPPTQTPWLVPSLTPSVTQSIGDTPVVPSPTRSIPIPSATPTKDDQPGKTPTMTPSPSNTSTSTHTPAPSNTPNPTNTKTPTNTPTPADTQAPYPDSVSSVMDKKRLSTLEGWLQ